MNKPSKTHPVCLAHILYPQATEASPQVTLADIGLDLYLGWAWSKDSQSLLELAFLLVSSIGPPSKPGLTAL